MPPVSPIDDYIAALDEPTRSTLQEVRERIRSLVPDAEEVISYGVCAFRLRGVTIGGFGAFRGHCSFFPFSGSVLPSLRAELGGYAGTKSALHFPSDRALEGEVIDLLVTARMREAFGTADGTAG